MKKATIFVICMFLVATSCQVMENPARETKFEEKNLTVVGEAKYYLDRSIVPTYIKLDIWNASAKNESYKTTIEFFSDPAIEIHNEQYLPNEDLHCKYTSVKASAKWVHCERSWNAENYRLSEVIDAITTYSGASQRSAHVVVI